MTRTRRQTGFTLLEVMVATVIMAIAVTGLLSSLSGSMRNAARLTSYDRAAFLARHKMDELLADTRIPRGAVLQANFDERSGWRGRVTPFDTRLAASTGYIIERIELEIWWMDGDQRKTFGLESLRRALLEQGRPL